MIAQNQTGKLNEFTSLVGHKSTILDWQFNPFNQNLLTSSSEDGAIKIWNVATSNATISLDATSRKVSTLAHHPTADSVLASGCLDKVQVWSIEKEYV